MKEIKAKTLGELAKKVENEKKKGKHIINSGGVFKRDGYYVVIMY